MAALPLAPREAHMVLSAIATGSQEAAAELALLLQERGLGGRGDDLVQRLDRWRGDRSGRAEASRKLAANWARVARGLIQNQASCGAPLSQSPPLGAILAEGFPDMLARRRDPSGEHWLTAGGRGLRLDPASPLIRAEWLAVGEAQGDAKGARITGAIALSEAEVQRWLGHRIAKCSTLRWVADERRVEALLEQRLGAIALANGPDPQPDAAAIAAFLAGKVRDEGLDLLPLSDASRALLTRAAYAGLAALSDAALRDAVADWLQPLLGRRLDSLDKGALQNALLGRLDYAERQSLDRLAPPQFTSPAGTHHSIDYADPGGPSVELRVQALFGLDRHPTYGRGEPLLLKLTSPGGKPIQTTRDLPGFWRGSWRDVVKDMKGRYPKHRWPDEPWTEAPSLKTKNAFEAGRK
jgi:ATP-dependent helicase HrpB